MIFLITGGMGAGKTVNALKAVRDLQLASGRPVCYTNRIELLGPALEFGWKEIDIKDWEQEPDGTIFLVDECHKDFPVRGGVSRPPAYIQNLAEHRHKGYDFFLVTQHPKNLDSFIRRLIGNPGWHKHYKRRAGAPLASCLKWDSVYERCEAPNSGDSAEVTNVAYPKEVYTWYKSASIHTAKFKIPKAFFMFAGGIVAVAVLLGLAYYKIRSSSDVPVHSVKSDEKGGGILDGIMKATGKQGEQHSSGSSGRGDRSEPMTVAEYVQSHHPRITGLPHTAPRYDELTKPKQVPYPAACMQMGERCDCFTQQATPMQVPAAVCKQIVKGGLFLDFLPSDAERRREEASYKRQNERQDSYMQHAGVRFPQTQSVAMDVQQAGQQQQPQLEGYEERKARENAQVTSRLRPNYPGK